jgi:O-acetyl-ADP-ribose deacetylase (regulator of RNase III)
MICHETVSTFICKIVQLLAPRQKNEADKCSGRTRSLLAKVKKWGINSVAFGGKNTDLDK